ncbi:MAG: gamma-glutamylcyclotransferase [Alphaproteobacteria bacterium]|nr:gamma-glutamylcyclotransferase [Alphaproteobacteria bacterium]
MSLTREQIQSGWVQRMAREAGHPMKVLSDEELAKSRHDMLARAPSPEVWVFGYGSLIWNPAFHFVERRVGTIHGHHRRFCLWTTLGRGSPDCPGLMLGLDRGGSCRGVVLRIAPDQVEAETDVLWRREMVSNAYVPTWVRAATEKGDVWAIAFTINRGHDRYAEKMSEEQAADIIARAVGRVGPCRDYLLNTVDHLDRLGIHDRSMKRLADKVRRQLAGAAP